MRTITVVSGCPGTGKTTIASALAAADPLGVHLESDVFFDFFAHRILSIRPEAHEQNGAAVRAAAAAAAAFATSGYQVVVDGVLGPWFVPTFLDGVAPSGLMVEYVVLRAPLDDTLRRALPRPRGDQAEQEEIVRHMHRGFEDLGRFEKHAVETGGHGIPQTLATVAERRFRGDFLLAPTV
ncbi:MAG TPA: AAA family ATPase [Actinomycetota bacterium]|nr:AAA family ATPase [Actinomycetota bacterium]